MSCEGCLTPNLRGIYLSVSHHKCQTCAIVHSCVHLYKYTAYPPVLHADAKTVGGREGFFTWLKDIFNKYTENKSHQTDATIFDRSATATTIDRPEIAVTKQPAESSRKVDVVNQKLANFGVAQSTMKFEDRNFRVEENNAEECGRTNAIQQLAIYASSRPRRVEAAETSKCRTVPSRFNPIETHRLEGNHGVIESAARDDLDALAYHRYYTSPTQCYRVPPQTRQLLTGSFVSNRNISTPIRAIMSFAPKNSKPPIREPNMPEKYEKKDQKKDKKEKKKPVIRTDCESVDSSENPAAMVAQDNPKSDPEAAFRYEWGVKLAEEPTAEASDNDNFSEKGRQYVTKRLWGVNLKQPKPDVEDAVSPTSQSPGRGAEEHRNASEILESGDTTIDEVKRNVSAKLNASANEPDTSDLKGTTAEYLSTPSNQPSSTSSSNDLTTAQQDTADEKSPMSSEVLRKIIKTSPNILKETIVIDDDYSIPEEENANAEISAWKNLVAKSKVAVVAEKDFLSAEHVQNFEMVSIRPEAPQPKLDVRVVRSIEDSSKDKNTEETKPGYKFVTSTNKSREAQKLDNSFSKKLHTANMQIRYMHQDTNKVARQYTGLLPKNSIVKTMLIKYPKFTLTFSTNAEDPEREKIINNVSIQQDNQKIDSQNHEEEKINISDTSDSLEDTKQFPLSTESQASDQSTENQASDQEQADNETEISLNQQDVDPKDTVRPASLSVSSESTQKDEYYVKNEDDYDETERFEDSYANYNRVNVRDKNASYINLNIPSNNRGSMKSDTIGESKSAKQIPRWNPRSIMESTISDSNVEDLVIKDISKNYIIDGDYVRIPGDPYPYSREHLEKWRMPSSKIFQFSKLIEREMSISESPFARSSKRNANDAYANAAGKSYDSHAAETVMETSGSGDDASAKNVGRSSGFCVSSRDQRVVSDCLRGDAADALGLRQWTEAFSRLKSADASKSEKMNETERDDNASLRAYHQ